MTDQEPNDAARRHEELAERALAEHARRLRTLQGSVRQWVSEAEQAAHERRVAAIERRRRWMVALVWVVGGGLMVVPPVVAAAAAFPATTQGVLVTTLALTVGLPLGNWITTYAPGLVRRAVKWVRGGRGGAGGGGGGGGGGVGGGGA